MKRYPLDKVLHRFGRYVLRRVELWPIAAKGRARRYHLMFDCYDDAWALSSTTSASDDFATLREYRRRIALPDARIVYPI
jgi:hypothetical protein